MTDAVSFKTRARTIDHLGREQIADCPTAVSELWKNAYDAYATEVSLHIFGGDTPIAAILDNGHGMDRSEFESKWLVVGTESKATTTTVPIEDRNGLPFRPKQGQKGIGRLSSGNLGSLLLIISKRSQSPCVAALIDWRLFENPFIFLQDIRVPIVEFSEPHELWQFTPSLFDTMMGNVWGDGIDSGRDERLQKAWLEYDELEVADGKPSTKTAIEQTLISTAFGERHLSDWPVWTGEHSSGTAMLMAELSFDLRAHLPSAITAIDSDVAEAARSNFKQTLLSFTDPYVAPDEEELYGIKSFQYSFTVWDGMLSRPIISGKQPFDCESIRQLEHLIEGEVDEHGIFHGRVRAFGQPITTTQQINPLYPVPARSDTFIGPFRLRIGTFEQEIKNSSYTREVYENLKAQVDQYGGFLIYRNGLRVLPYGREGNDFFDIEKRRTQNAGREFWSYRRLFGRVALTRQANPNLRDKAGREGIIDNKAAKVFRDIIINILRVAAREYFGSNSDLRKDLLPEIQLTQAKIKAQEAERKVLSRRRKELRQQLRARTPEVRTLVSELEILVARSHTNALPITEGGLLDLRTELSKIKERRAELRIGEAPRELGALEEEYREFKLLDNRAAEYIRFLSDAVALELERIQPKSSRDLAYSELSRNATHLQNRLRKWSVEAKSILNGELRRISDIVDERNKRYHATTLPWLANLDAGRATLLEVLDQLESEKERLDRDNADLFEPYISTLRSLKDSVDIEALVSFTMDESTNLRAELDRLNALAQLGITVEIIGHEFEGLETTFTRGLESLPEQVKQSSSFDTIRSSHAALVDRLRFLSPLKLSGERQRAWITGMDISKYVINFFGDLFETRSVEFQVTPEFLSFSVYEQPSRLYPVFINLVNNAVYWVGHSQAPGQIILGVRDSKVIVSDNGPGVEATDLKNLFTLFFTRKIRGGRGVGLYLCRANLAAGGHTISYAVDGRYRQLAGANFVIEFKGVRYE